MRLSACIIFSMTAVALAQDGGLVFTERCSVCHGDGHGTERGPNLANSRRVRSRSLEELLGVIRDGIPASGMPPFRLPAAELEAVTAYVRSMSASAAESNAPGNRVAGEQFFFGKGHCAGCHMALGRGKAVGPDLSAVGREMTLAEVDEAVRRPSARIKPGYKVVTVRLRDGRTVRGFARNRSRYSIQIQDAITDRRVYRWVVSVIADGVARRLKQHLRRRSPDGHCYRSCPDNEKSVNLMFVAKSGQRI